MRASSNAAAVYELRDYKASLTNGKIRERLVRAFDPAQLREGAMSTGGQVGVLSRVWVPHPSDLRCSCASWRLRPARLALEHKTARLTAASGQSFIDLIKRVLCRHTSPAVILLRLA